MQIKEKRKLLALSSFWCCNIDGFEYCCEFDCGRNCWKWFKVFIIHSFPTIPVLQTIPFGATACIESSSVTVPINSRPSGDVCPSCMKAELESIPISLHETYKFDYDASRGVTLEFEAIKWYMSIHNILIQYPSIWNMQELLSVRQEDFGKHWDNIIIRI